MTEIQCRELVGAYAVGALEPPEAAMLADHLLTCTRCRHVLDEAEQTAALLASVPPEAFIDEPADPNDPLLMRTLHAIRLEAATTQAPPAQAPQLRSVRRPGSGSGTGSGSGGNTSDAGFPGWSGQTARSHRRRKARASSASQQRRHLAFAGAAAAVVLVLGGGVLLGSKLAGPDDGRTGTRTVAEKNKDATTAPPPNAVGPAQSSLEGENPTTGAQLDIEVTTDGDSVKLNIEATGLPAGVACDVDVVATGTVDGGQSAGQLTVGPDGTGTLVTSVPVPVTALVSVTVSSPTGEILVTASKK
jgi:hypothetical protein